MILQAIPKFDIDPVNSVLIGDKKRDILAGSRTGIGKNLYIQNLFTDRFKLRIRQKQSATFYKSRNKAY